MFSPKDILDPFAWVWFALALAGLCRLRQRNFRACCLLLSAVLGMSALEILSVPHRLMCAKENPYQRDAASPDFEKSMAGAQAVVMCGGMLQASRHDFSGANYGDSVDRFLKAVDLARRLSLPLVLGGGEVGGKGSPLESAYERNWLRSWDLLNLPVFDLGPCQNTHDEALAAATLAGSRGWRKIILVTSGYHMDRALGAFNKAGLHVVPAACDCRGGGSEQPKAAWRFVPDTDGAQELRLYLCEEAGAVYYRCRGWL